MSIESNKFRSSNLEVTLSMTNAERKENNGGFVVTNVKFDLFQSDFYKN